MKKVAFFKKGLHPASITMYFKKIPLFFFHCANPPSPISSKFLPVKKWFFHTLHKNQTSLKDSELAVGCRSLAYTTLCQATLDF